MIKIESPRGRCNRSTVMAHYSELFSGQKSPEDQISIHFYCSIHFRLHLGVLHGHAKKNDTLNTLLRRCFYGF